MLYILFSLLLFLGIVFFQTIQGTFSALIMLVLTVISAAVAVNFYAPISQAWLLEYIPDYADAASLIVLFTVTLVVLRTIADNFVHGNIILWTWPDRIAACFLSIWTALLLVGVSSIAFQMLPFDGQVLLFNRFKHDSNLELVRADIFPYADNFAASILSTLSHGSMAGGNELSMVHPDWPGEVSAQRIAVQRESKHAVAPGLVKVTKAWKHEGPLLVKEHALNTAYRGGYFKVPPKITAKRNSKDDSLYLTAHIELDAKAADADGYHRFSWGQIRLVGFNGINRTYPVNVYAIGVRDPDLTMEMNYLRVTVLEPPPADDDEAKPEVRNYGLISRKQNGPLSVDVVFEVKQDFTPWFLEYKRWGRQEMPKIEQESPVKEQPVIASTDRGSVGEVAQGGWHNQFQIDPSATGFNNQLPFRLMSGSARGGETEINGSKLSQGTITGNIGTAGGLDSGVGAPVTEFDVPAGKQILRVECRFVAASNHLINNVFGMVGSIAQQKAYDAAGNVYLPVGKYIMLDSSGQGQQVELIFNGAGVEGEVRAGQDQFRSITRNDLQANGGKIGFLYVIPSGTKMSRFEPGAPFESQTLEITAP